MASNWLRFPMTTSHAPEDHVPETAAPGSRGWNLFCLLVLPAIYLGLFGEFTVGRGTIVPPSLIIAGVAMVLFTASAAMQVRHVRRLPLLFPVAWYFLAACLSGWHSVSHLHWIRGLLELALAFCFFYFPYFFLHNRRQLELFLKTLVLLAGATVVFAILQAAFFPSVRGVLSVLYRREDLWWIVGWGWRGRLVGNWIHPSYFGSVLNVAAPFALLYCVCSRAVSRRCLALMLYVALAAGIALTGTRTPMLAFVLSSIVFVILAEERRRGWGAVACATALVIALSFFHFRFAPPDVGSTARLPRSIAVVERLQLKAPQSTSTLKMRWFTQSEALSLFSSSPLFGIGMRNYPDRARNDPMAEFSIHNSPVQNLTELGLLGLVAFAILMGAALRLDFRPKLSSCCALRPLRAALFCSSAAILLESLAENSLSVWQVMALFWLVRGISLAVSHNPDAFLNLSEPVPAAEYRQVYLLRS